MNCYNADGLFSAVIPVLSKYTPLWFCLLGLDADSVSESLHGVQMIEFPPVCKLVVHTAL